MAHAGPARNASHFGGPAIDCQSAEWSPHIHREVIHHGAEVLLLRALYRHRTGLRAG